MDNKGIDFFLDMYRNDCQLRAFTPGTVSANVYRIERFLKFINKNPAEADKTDILSYLAELRKRENAYRTILGMFTALSGFYDLLEELELVKKNPVRPIVKKYLRQYKDHPAERKAISVEEAAKLVYSILDTRDRAIVILLLKTGLRRQELANLDVSDVNLQDMSITLKPMPKRTNRTVFFDEEARRHLISWLRARENWVHNGEQSLFITRQGKRVSGPLLKQRIVFHAKRVGLHNPDSPDLKDHFSPHCCRHWFTTHLRKNKMPREFIQELRGDVRKEAIDIYDHIDNDELKESYLNCIPILKR